jgi:hypothetical protein
MAPTLYQVEETYRDQVNFIMVNGDDPKNWPIIEALGVDAIPHLAFVESDGTVDTALIGPVPKEWLDKNIDTLLENSAPPRNTNCEEMNSNDEVSIPLSPLSSPPATSSSTTVCAASNGNNARKPLPFQMLDVFANRSPEERRIHIEMESTKK